MIIVSDTVPLRYLIYIDEVDILESLFTKILIPQAVFDDMQRPKTPQKVKDWLNHCPSWLEIRQADTSLYPLKSALARVSVKPSHWRLN